MIFAQLFFIQDSIDKDMLRLYYNYRYITIVIIHEGESAYAAQNKDYEGHDHKCSHRSCKAKGI